MAQRSPARDKPARSAASPRNLQTTPQQRSKGEAAREIAELAGLSHQTVLNVLNGNTWWDAITIARLERALDTKLWGEEHRKHRTPRRR